MPTYETPGKVELDLRLPAGEIAIDTTAGRSTTEVELIPLRDDDATREAMQAARTEMQESGGVFTILVEVPSKKGLFGRQPQFELRVRAPEGSRVVCRTRSADVSGHGRFQSVDVKTASGDISFENVDESASAQTASGDVRLGRVGGFVHVNTASGDAFVESARSGIHVNAVSGDVHVREAFGETHVHTVSGDQQLEAIANGPVSCQSVSGDVQIGIAQGSRVFINAGSLSGDTSSDLALSDGPPADEGDVVNVRANTVSGDIHVGRGRALTTGAFTG